MGMGVYDRSPTAPEGEYFHGSVWGWRPLAEYRARTFPGATSTCRHRHSNDGDGLTAAKARRLTDFIDEKLRSGRVRAHVEARDRRLVELADEPCSLCGATGRFARPVLARRAS